MCVRDFSNAPNPTNVTIKLSTQTLINEFNATYVKNGSSISIHSKIIFEDIMHKGEKNSWISAKNYDSSECRSTFCFPQKIINIFENWEIAQHSTDVTIFRSWI